MRQLHRLYIGIYFSFVPLVMLEMIHFAQLREQKYITAAHLNLAHPLALLQPDPYLPKINTALHELLLVEIP